MAKIYGEISASGLMTFDKSFARSNGQPLDSTEIFYSLAAAQEYAQTNVAYVGQKIVVVETVDEVTTVTHYGIEADNSLKELGAIPVGDNVTVEVVDGKIQLADLDGHTSGTYQPFLVDGKIEWREPSATTVEGLDGRLTTAENEIDALQGVVGKAAEGDNEATGLIKDVADINDKIGEVTEGKTVVEMIADAKTEATYDDEDLQTRLSVVEEDYLKTEDKTDLQGKIDLKANQSALEALDAAYKKADEDLAAADTALGQRIDGITSDYLKNADKEALQSQITTNANAIERLTNGVSTDEIDSVNDLINYVNEHGSVVTGMQEDIGENADAISALDGRVTTLEGEMDDVQAAINTANTNISSNTTAINAVKSLVGETSVDDQIKAAFETANLGQYATTGALADLTTRVATIEGDYLVEADKDELVGLINALENADKSINEALATKASTSDLNSAVDRIAALEAVGSEKNIIASVDTNQFSIDGNRNLTLQDIAIGKVTGLTEALAGKVEKVEGSRLLTSDEATKLEKLVLGDNGEVEVSGKVAAGNVEGLDAWITNHAASLEGLSENNLTDALVEKLNAIEAGAQVNKIENISINDTPIVISNKTANIPIAAAGILGVVTSSTEMNKVTVAADGTMEVNTISVSKLVQNEGESLVLNGGSATA